MRVVTTLGLMWAVPTDELGRMHMEAAVANFKVRKALVFVWKD
jgi:hypothetical protein